MPFEAPTRVAYTTRKQCDERSRFDYDNACSTRQNYKINFTQTRQIAQQYSLTPDGGPLDGRHRQCVGSHRNRHTMCRYCIAATEDQPWFTKAYAYIALNNPPTPRVPEHNRSSHLLTRMCRLCEYREEVLLAQLGGSAPGAPVLPPPPGLVPIQNHPTQYERDWASSWPTNRCTCEKRGLYNGILCLPHRKKHWLDFKKQNDVNRRHNRKYLINTERDGAGNRIDATADTKQNRDDQGLYRACRCGEDPVATIGEATVMQCMACEGIVHLQFTPGGNQPVPLTPPNPNQPPSPLQLAMNSLATPDAFTLTGGWDTKRRQGD